jgi:hypothetical protein
MRSLRKRARPVTVAILVAGLLSACAEKSPSPFAVRSASIDHDTLSAQLDWHPSALMLDALDHGIALDFEVKVEAQGPSQLGWRADLGNAHWRRELRYFPLTRQYQMRDPEQDAAHDEDTRNYPARALLVAAISDLRLNLPANWLAATKVSTVDRYTLRIDLQRDNLPGALRLPALIDADWRLSTGKYVWPAAPSAG